MLFFVLIAVLPIFIGALLNFTHELVPEEDQWTHVIVGFGMSIHMAIVQIDHALRLPQTINDLKKLSKASNMVLNNLEYVEHKPNEAIRDMLQKSGEDMEHSKLLAEYEPPEWAYRLYDDLQKSGKLRSDAKQLVANADRTS